jgi:hypothetical protein
MYFTAAGLLRSPAEAPGEDAVSPAFLASWSDTLDGLEADGPPFRLLVGISTRRDDTSTGMCTRSNGCCLSGSPTLPILKGRPFVVRACPIKGPLRLFALPAKLPISSYVLNQQRFSGGRGFQPRQKATARSAYREPSSYTSFAS